MSISQNYPNVSPQLLIELSNTQKLDPRVTFARASTGTYYDANGVLRTAPSGVARFDHNPVTGESEGLLRENQATNLVLYSEDYSNAAWTKSNVTVESNVVVAPDGTLTGDLLKATSTSSGGTVAAQAQTVTGAQGSYTVSYFIKPSGFNFAILAIRNIAGTRFVWQWFDLTGNGAVGSRQLNAFTFVSAKIYPTGNGWFKCDLTVITDIVDSGVGTFVGMSDTNNSLFATSDGVSGIFIWGAQLEANSYTTSYIPTEASQVTRAADTATLTNTDTYNTDEFTAVTKPFGVAGVASNLVTLNGDAPIERLYVYPRNISQDQINTLVENDGYWSWRIVGADFALPLFTTDGTVEVDWGDGTVETLTTAVHTFTNASPHTVRFKLTSGTFFRPRIDNNATHKTKVVALGSAPSNMLVDCYEGFFNCTNLKSIDATLIGGANFTFAWHSCSSLTSFPLIDTSSGTNFYAAWYECSGLTSFPLINTSAGTNFQEAWSGCNSLTSFPLIDTSSGTDFTAAWYNCTSLTSFPLIDTSSGTNFLQTWIFCSSLTEFPLIDTSSGTEFTNTWRECSSLTSFPLIDTSSSTDFRQTWQSCTSLTSFPLIDTSSGTNFFYAWRNCSSLTSFPLIDTSSGTNFSNAWYNCTSLTSFPLINTSAGTNFNRAWLACSGLTEFPLIDTSSGTNFQSAWRDCTDLTDFPANMFDSWTGVPIANCFLRTWDGCSALTTTSVENILVSIDTSAVSAPATGTEITIDYDTGTGALTSATNTAITSLKAKNWTIKINGVLE